MPTNAFVFDTNSLVSAALSPRSTNAQALRRALSLGIVVYSAATWEEFMEVLFRVKFDRYFSVEDRWLIVDRLLLDFQELPVIPLITDCRDSKDNKFLDLAVTAKAACLITGDDDLLTLHPFREIPILNAARFLETF